MVIAVLHRNRLVPPTKPYKVQLFVPREAVISKENLLRIYVVARMNSVPVDDAMLIARLITDGDIIETTNCIHINEGIYKCDFMTTNFDYAIVYIASTNYEAETYVSVYRPITTQIDVSIIRKILMNNMEIRDNQLIIYDDDGATPLVVFNLYDKFGNPTELNVYKRVRVKP